MNKPFFSRPVIYTSLLTEQETGIIGNHAIFANVIADEFTIRTPDALMSGLATELIIKSSCPDLINPDKLLLCDIQHILASIKIASYGNELEVMLQCPQCKEHDPYEINLQANLPNISVKKWFQPLTIDKLTFSFRSPTYKEYTAFSISNFRILKQLYFISHCESPEEYSSTMEFLLDQKSKLTTLFYANCLNTITIENHDIITNNQFITEWFNQCDISIQRKLVEYIESAIKESYLNDFSITCSECQHNFIVPIDLDVCSQFRQRLIPASDEEIIGIIKKMGDETKELSNDLLKMCWFMRGSISYSEAYSLTLHDRQCIAKIIEENINITKESGMPFV